MKIAISSMGTNLESQIDPRFGRCSNFLVVDASDLSYKSYENKAQFEGHGAGISAAQFLINLEVKAVISGSVGPNAFQALSAANIQMFTGSGSIKDAVKEFTKGNLTPLRQPRKSMYGRGMGRGGGQGRRM